MGCASRNARGQAAALVGLLVSLGLGAAGCRQTPPTAASAARQAAQAHWGSLQHVATVTGQIEPAASAELLTPQLQGQDYAQLTVTYLIPSGTPVVAGQVVASFDRTALEQAAADAEQQYRSLTAQVEQQQAQNEADAAKRNVALQEALAARGQAALELEKRTILPALKQQTDALDLADARDQVASLQQAEVWDRRQAADQVRVLQLQRDEQKALWQQAEAQASQLVLRAPIAGMAAQDTPPWVGQVRPGTRLYSGTPVLRIFDPHKMVVEAQISEADRPWVPAHAAAQVRVDAYPGLTLPAQLESVSPIGEAALGTPIRSFAAVFTLEHSDARVLPDLNASVVIASQSQPGWLVPRAEVNYENGAAYIWARRRRDGKSVRQPVRVGGFGNGMVLIQCPPTGWGPCAQPVHAATAKAAPGAER
ncbi:MAG: efflux RND transporter periplasmic adaptor subunit [Terriglobales bacterium]